MSLTVDKINQVLELLRLWHFFKDVAFDMRQSIKKGELENDNEYLLTLTKKQGIIIREVMNSIDTSSYFLFLRLYQSLKENRMDVAEDIKTKLLLWKKN